MFEKILSIQKYKYGKINTAAFVISAVSEDGEFSANLVNEVVNSFFENEQLRTQAQYQNYKVSSRFDSRAQIELDVAKKIRAVHDKKWLVYI